MLVAVQYTASADADGCVLTDAELDHTAGLLLLREGVPFSIFSTSLVRQWLSRSFPVEPLLACFANPKWLDLPLDKTVVLAECGLLLRACRYGERHRQDYSGDR